VVIYPAQVQGESAAHEVASGVRYFNRTGDVDVILVARGGGSIEDLAAFNDEGLARTVAACELPVISAIGHETDFTILDFVADLRAPTPSAAAELVIHSKVQIEERLETWSRRLIRGARYQLLMARQHLQKVTQHRALSQVGEGITRRQQRLDDLGYRMASAGRAQLQRYRQRVEIAGARLRAQDLRYRLEGVHRKLEHRTSALAATMRALLLAKRSRLEQLGGRVQALSPLNILERGYSLVFDADGCLVKSSDQVGRGESITVHLHRGQIQGTVTGVKE
jgi:exodeoxyribonuclease VII large subunit